MNSFYSILSLNNFYSILSVNKIGLLIVKDAFSRLFEIVKKQYAKHKRIYYITNSLKKIPDVCKYKKTKFYQYLIGEIIYLTFL